MMNTMTFSETVNVIYVVGGRFEKEWNEYQEYLGAAKSEYSDWLERYGIEI